MFLFLRKKNGEPLTPKDNEKIRNIVKVAYLVSQPPYRIALPDNYDQEETVAHEIPDLVQVRQILDKNVRN